MIVYIAYDVDYDSVQFIDYDLDRLKDTIEECSWGRFTYKIYYKVDLKEDTINLNADLDEHYDYIETVITG
jgi:hypothetical protein